SILMPLLAIALASNARSAAMPSAPLAPADGIAERPNNRPGGATSEIAALALKSQASRLSSTDAVSASPMIFSAVEADACLISFVSAEPSSILRVGPSVTALVLSHIAGKGLSSPTNGTLGGLPDLPTNGKVIELMPARSSVVPRPSSLIEAACG